MARRTRWLASIGAVALVSVVVCDGASGQARNMSLEAHISELTGGDAADCGTHTWVAPVPEAMHQSLVCARDAAQQHRAYRVIQRGFGEDSEIARGILGERDGSTFWFDYDSAPCGGPGCAERFETKPCVLSNVVVLHDVDGRHQFRHPLGGRVLSVFWCLSACGGSHS
jgi:hypothetical protein